jgi:hypothetical protein
MSKSLIVAFRAAKASGDKVSLYCKSDSEIEWPQEGRIYDNWKSLLGTMSEILGRAESEFESLRLSGFELGNQRVTTQQLKLFGFPNLDMLPYHQSYQGIDV